MNVALWLATYLLHSTVLCGSVLVFRRTLRRLEGAEHIWRAAMLLPVVSATLTRAIGIGWRIDGTPINDIASGSWTSDDIAAAAALVCASVGALLVIRDWIAHWVFVRQLGDRSAVDDGRAPVADLLEHEGLRRPVRLTSSAHALSPIVLGRTEICLPERALKELTLAQLRGLVAHEVAHILRHDHRWFALLASFESAFFVQPLNRIARRETQYLAEVACDDWAARELSDPMALADCLVEVAGWSRSANPVTVPGIAARKGLTERVHRLIGPRVPQVRMALGPCLWALAIVSLALPGFGVAPARQGPAAADSAYARGYEAGRRFAAGGESAGDQWRADLERRLQTQAARR